MSENTAETESEVTLSEGTEMGGVPVEEPITSSVENQAEAPVEELIAASAEESTASEEVAATPRSETSASGNEIAQPIREAKKVKKSEGGINRRVRKEKIGVVTGNAMQKTIVVSVERKIKHPMYGKFIKKTTKFAVHDEKNDAGVGDTVVIMETRPLSKTKSWRLVKILERAK